MQGKLSKRIAVSPAEESFAIDFFGFEFVGFAIEILNGLHGRRMAGKLDFEI